MPRTWSNRKISHIDLNAGKDKRLPAVLWVFIVFGVGMMTMYTSAVVQQLRHPAEIEVHQGDKPLNGPSPLRGADFGH